MSDSEPNKPDVVPQFIEEEYHFSEDEPEMGSFDPLQTQPITEQSTPPASGEAPKRKLSFPDMSQVFQKVKIKPILDAIQQNFILRVSLIVVLVLLLTAIIYRCSSNPLAEKTNQKMASIPVQHTSTKPQEVIISQVPTVTFAPKSQPSTGGSDMTNSQFQRLEKANAELQSQIRDMSSQMTNLRNNVDTTTASLKVVAEQLAQLATTIGNEAQKTAGLADLIKQQKNPFSVAKMDLPVPQLQCALQAIIPGRAWLLCSNGETLTVSQGTQVSNYGEIRYIDAQTGQVLTSSGQTITFSQEDR